MAQNSTPAADDRPITKDDVIVNGFGEVVCTSCGETGQRSIYDDIDSFLAEFVKDAASEGWEVIEGDMTCPDCVKAYRVEQSEAAASKGRGR